MIVLYIMGGIENNNKILMPKFNDLDLKNWKEIDLNMDSLWMIPERKKWWKHSNFYHWNFVPQIWFWCMNEAQKVWFKLKSIIIKNIRSLSIIKKIWEHLQIIL